MDEGKELQYRRIVVMSLKNGADYVNDTNPDQFDSVPKQSPVTFDFDLSEKLQHSATNSLFFPATAVVAATNVEASGENYTFVELFTKPPDEESDIYGIVVQYKEN